MLLRKIEVFLRRTEMTPSEFGRQVAHDPSFVFDLRRGRIPGPRIQARAEHFMNTHPETSHAN